MSHSDTFNVPPRLGVLAQALRPVHQRLSMTLTSPVVATTPWHQGIRVLAQQSLRELRQLPDELALHIELLNTRVLADAAATDAQVHAAVREFGAWVDGWRMRHHWLRSLDLGGDALLARSLLVSVQRHSLVELDAWLGELIGALRAPQSRAGADGEVTVALKLTPAPELAALAQHLDDDGWALIDALMDDD